MATLLLLLFDRGLLRDTTLIASKAAQLASSPDQPQKISHLWEQRVGIQS
jgi:hypothetical protein